MGQVVEKLWGREEWLVNCSAYCAKYLYLNPGFRSSLHMHRVKDETFIVLEGACALETMDKVRVLEVGESFRVLPGTYHRFMAAKGQPCKILEVSTHHSEEDVVRMEPSEVVR